MEIIPVLDLMQGHVVRGIGGRRDEYQPIVSQLTDSSRPLDVARAIRDRFALDRFYVADLDSLQGEIPHWDAYGWLIADGFELEIDLGSQDIDQARRLLRRGTARVILSLESFAAPADLPRWVQELSPHNLVFSLDLKAGTPLTASGQWPTDPLQIAAHIAEAGIRNLIVLDLQHVGSQAGLGTLDLCRQIATAHPHFNITTGGGIRSDEDLQTLAREPIARLLVASALHDGTLTPAAIQRLSRSSTPL